MNKTLAISVAVIIVAVGIFFIGYQYGHQQTAAKYEAQIAKGRAAQAEAAQMLEEQYREKENESAKKVAAALAARDKALSDASRVRADAERVRLQSEGLSKQLSRAATKHAASGNGDSERLGKCESLLSESASLLGTSTELAGELICPNRSRQRCCRSSCHKLKMVGI